MTLWIWDKSNDQHGGNNFRVPEDDQFFQDLGVLHHDTEKYVEDHEEAMLAKEPAKRSDSPPPPRPLMSKFKLAQERATYDLPFKSNQANPADDSNPPKAPDIMSGLKSYLRNEVLKAIAEEIVSETHPKKETVDKSAFKAGGEQNDVDMKESDKKASAAALKATLAKPAPKKVPPVETPVTKQAVKPLKDSFKQGVAPESAPETVVDKTAFSAAAGKKLDNGDKSPAPSKITTPNPNRASLQSERRAKRKVGSSFVASAKRPKTAPKKSGKTILDNYKRKLNQARIDVKKAFERLMDGSSTPGGDRQEWARWRKLLHKTAEYSPEGLAPGYFNNTSADALPPSLKGSRRYGVWKSFMDFQTKLNDTVKEEYGDEAEDVGRVYRDNA